MNIWIEIWNWKLELKIEVENWNYKLKLKIEKVASWRQVLKSSKIPFFSNSLTKIN